MSLDIRVFFTNAVRVWRAVASKGPPLAVKMNLGISDMVEDNPDAPLELELPGGQRRHSGVRGLEARSATLKAGQRITHGTREN